MLNTIIIIFSIYGLTFLIKDASGPFDILSKIRHWLMLNKYVGVFFFKLFDCVYCSGTYSGIIIYLISQKDWSLNFIILWALAGAAISLIIESLLNKLHK